MAYPNESDIFNARAVLAAHEGAVAIDALPPSVSSPVFDVAVDFEGAREDLRRAAEDEERGRTLKPDSVERHRDFIADGRVRGAVFAWPEVFVDDAGKLAGVLSYAGVLDDEGIKRVKGFARAEGFLAFVRRDSGMGSDGYNDWQRDWDVVLYLSRATPNPS